MNLRKAAQGRPCQITEQWRPVVGWEGLYEVSDFGRVRSVSRWVRCRKGKRLVVGKVLKLRFDGHYIRAALSNRSRGATFHVHRLVAFAFVSGKGTCVRHLDGDGTNNAARNLAWGSHKENEADKLRHGRRFFGLRHHRAVLSEAKVREIRRLHAQGLNQLAIAARTGAKRGTVGNVVRGVAYKDVV